MTPRGPARFSKAFRRLALAATLGVLAVTLSGCSWSEALGMGWPEGITPEAHVNRELWVGAVIASLVVGVIVWGLIFWSVAFHRHKQSDTELPRQFGYNMPLELALTVTPFLIISVLFYFTVVVQEKMLHVAKDPEVVVDVTGLPMELEVRLSADQLQRRHPDLRRRRRGAQEGHGLQAGRQRRPR